MKKEKLNIISYNKAEIFLFALTILWLAIIAFGKFNRMPVMEQLAVADNLEVFNYLYPSINSENPSHSSGYFPGMAYFIYLVKFFTPDYFIVEVLLLFSIIFVILFFYIIRNIIIDFYKKNIHFNNYWLLCIIFSFWPAKGWLWYAIELKQDILAFTLVALAMLVCKPYKIKYERNILNLLISIILFSYAIILKQQVIFIIFGMGAYSLYSFFNKNYFFIFYTFIIILVTLSIYYIFYQNNDLWWFTITRHSENTFLTLSEWLKLHYVESILIIQFLLFVFFSSFHNLCTVNFNSKFQYLLSIIKSNIWFYLTFSFALTGLISSLSRGGNSGNTGVSLILFFPFIYIFIYNFKKKVLIFVAYSVLLFEFHHVIFSLNKYISAVQFKSQVNKIKEDKNLILINRETYFASRLLRKENTLVSLSTKQVLNKFYKKPYNKDMIKNELLKTNYDYIILNNNFEFGEDLNERQINKKYYKKLFSNKAGYIYKKI